LVIKPCMEVESDEEEVKDKALRKNMKVKCGHPKKPYYAKGMCYNCYHKNGRQKQAILCEHLTRKHYARGMCKACYLKIHKAK
jgi:hypothetical protein